MYGSATIIITITTFLITLVLMLWRPKGLNEAIPAACGAFIVFISGSVSVTDLFVIGNTVSGAAVTIMATIVMAIVLESFGFFTWAAEGLANRAKGSGIRLFWYVNLLCFLMTLFFNNDGSILITTPILIILLQKLGLKNHQKIPYLISGALIATASSAPIGVSNIVNLIALEIIDMDLYKHTEMMFVPATLGLLFLVTLIFFVVYRDLPRKIPTVQWGSISNPRAHPLGSENQLPVQDIKSRNRFMMKILLFVFLVRVALFVASFIGIPVWLVAVLGSCVLLIWRWINLRISPADMLRKTPWHIIVFAFSMYVLIYGLHNIGLTEFLIQFFQPIVSEHLLNASLLMGGLISLLSIIFNNHPALMVGTLTLTSMSLDPLTLKIAYLANVIGSDMGSLLLPIGTLASLIWLHILRQHKVKVNWKDYIRVTFVAIPPTVIFTLVCLYYWVALIY
jgi:arsenical pump membrane protein